MRAEVGTPLSKSKDMTTRYPRRVSSLCSSARVTSQTFADWLYQEPGRGGDFLDMSVPTTARGFGRHRNVLPAPGPHFLFVEGWGC